MRKALARRKGERLNFTAKVEKSSYKTDYEGRQIKTWLFVDIRHEDIIVVNHLWFTDGKWSSELESGHIVSFDARIKKYEKGYKGYRYDECLEKPVRKDYKLSHPTRVEVLACQICM